MEIRCPECGYSREVNPDSIAPDLTVATCPKCNAKFRFRPDESIAQEEQGSSEFSLEKTVQDAAASEMPAAKMDESEIESSSTQTSSQGTTSEEPVPHAESDDEPSRTVRPEDLYPPSMRGTASSASDESEQPRQDSDEPSLKMAYSDGKPLEGMPTDVPWAQVKELGFFPAMKETIKGVLFKPTLFYEIMDKAGRFSIPFSFFILVSLAAVLVETSWQGVFGNPLFPAESVKPMSVDELFSIMFISPLILVTYLYVTGTILHIALKLAGAATGGIGVTLRVLCYASSADLLSIVPVVGPLIGGVWKLVIVVKGLKTAHGTTYTRVVPPVALLVLILVSFVVYTLKSQGIL